MSKAWLGLVVIGFLSFSPSSRSLGGPTETQAPASSEPDITSAKPDVREADPTSETIDAEPFQLRKTGKDHERLIYRVSALPPFELAKILKELSKLEDGLPSSHETGKAESHSLAIVSSLANNRLVLSGTPEAIDEVTTLLEGLDRPSSPVMLTVEIGEATLPKQETLDHSKAKAETSGSDTTIEQWRWNERPADMKTISRVQLTTLDNQPCLAQIGARIPVSSVLPSGDVAQTANVGIVVSITPRVNGDGSIVMDVDVEQSQLDTENDKSPASRKSEATRQPISTMTIHSSLLVPDGRPAILGAATPRGTTDKALVVVITPRVLSQSATQQPPVGKP